MQGGTWKRVVLALALSIFAFINLSPIVWAMLVSVRQPIDAFTSTLTLDFVPTLEFHWQVWAERGFGQFLLNSMIVSVATVLISVSCGTMAAYQLSRMPATRSRQLLIGILAMRMFPHILLALPFFVIAQALHIVDTYLGLVLAFVAINQPKELYEASAIDGCNAWQTFVRVALPMVWPGLWVTSLFSLLLAYNEFLFALVLSGPRTRTLPVAISEYGGEDITYWSLSAAAAIGITLPIVLFMVILQKQLVRGLSMGAVKG